MPKFSTTEAAKVLHVSEKTVRNWITRRTLRATRRKMWLIDAETLLEFRTPKEKKANNYEPF